MSTRSKKTSTDPQVKKFLGLEGDLGKGLGLDNDFAYKIVKAVGNYGEVYEATFGSKGLGLPRGLNNLYRNGGLHVSVFLVLRGRLTRRHRGQATVTPRLRSSVAATARGAGGRLSPWLPMRPTTSRVGTSLSASAFSPIARISTFRSISSPGRMSDTYGRALLVSLSTRFWSRRWASSRRPCSVC